MAETKESMNVRARALLGQYQREVTNLEGNLAAKQLQENKLLAENLDTHNNKEFDLEQLKNLDRDRLLKVIEEIHQNIIKITGEPKFISAADSLNKLEQNDYDATEKINNEIEQTLKKFGDVGIPKLKGCSRIGVTPSIISKRAQVIQYLEQLQWDNICDPKDKWCDLNNPFWKTIESCFPSQLINALKEARNKFVGQVKMVEKFHQEVTGTYTQRKRKIQAYCQTLEKVNELCAIKATENNVLPTPNQSGPRAEVALQFSLNEAGRAEFKKNAELAIAKRTWLNLLEKLMGHLFFHNLMAKIVHSDNGDTQYQPQFDEVIDGLLFSPEEASACYFNSKGELEIRYTFENQDPRASVKRNRIRIGRIDLNNFLNRDKMKAHLKIIAFNKSILGKINFLGDPLCLMGLNPSEPKPCLFIGETLLTYREFFTHAEDMIAAAKAIQSNGKRWNFYNLETGCVQFHELICCPAQHIAAFLSEIQQYIQEIPDIKPEDDRMLMMVRLIEQSKILYPELYPAAVAVVPENRFGAIA